jgi:hypothetical protein
MRQLWLSALSLVRAWVLLVWELWELLVLEPGWELWELLVLEPGW